MNDLMCLCVNQLWFLRCGSSVLLAAAGSKTSQTKQPIKNFWTKNISGRFGTRRHPKNSFRNSFCDITEELLYLRPLLEFLQGIRLKDLSDLFTTGGILRPRLCDAYKL